MGESISSPPKRNEKPPLLSREGGPSLLGHSWIIKKPLSATGRRALPASGRRTQPALGKELPLFYSGGAPSLSLGRSSLSRTRAELPLSHSVGAPSLALGWSSPSPCAGRNPRVAGGCHSTAIYVRNRVAEPIFSCSTTKRMAFTGRRRSQLPLLRPPWSSLSRAFPGAPSLLRSI